MLLSEIQVNVSSENLESTKNNVLSEIKEVGFDKAAIKLSISNSAKDGGNIGWINENKLSMTIYALSSGPGISGIAVIRISGTKTDQIISSLTKCSPPKIREATLRKITNPKNGELIDEGLVLYFRSPNSYTGEDMAEFHVHGSRAVIEAIHNSISKIKNSRIADPGEFTKIAFQNGKINLLKAESIADLISSETEIQRQQAIRIMSGKSSKKFNEWREKLLKILSNVEAKIDFPEENLSLIHISEPTRPY